MHFALHANNHYRTVVRRLYKTATVTSSVWMAAYPDFPQVSNARSQQSLLARYPMTPLLPGANAATRAAYLVAVQNRREAIKTVTHTALDLAAASQYEHALLTHLAAPVAGTHTSCFCYTGRFPAMFLCDIGLIISMTEQLLSSHFTYLHLPPPLQHSSCCCSASPSSSGWCRSTGWWRCCSSMGRGALCQFTKRPSACTKRPSACTKRPSACSKRFGQIRRPPSL